MNPQNTTHRILPPSTCLMPLPAVMVTCRGGAGNGKDNIIAIAWTGIVCSEPPMLSIAVRPGRFSHKLLLENGDFVVNVPSADQVNLADRSGMISGRDYDKFLELGLTPAPASQVNAAIIRECPLALECRTRQRISLGTHDLFLGEILAVQAREDVLDAQGHLNLDAVNALGFYPSIGGKPEYRSPGPVLGHFGVSVEKGRQG